jgi:putative PIN family toxin of toxin-antitoxin system
VRCILDTNVVVSGAFFGGTPRRVLELWTQDAFGLVVSRPIVREYLEVISRRPNHPRAAEAREFVELMSAHGDLVQPVRLTEPICRDPDDDTFVACALGCREPRPLIVSGDRDLLAVSGYRGIEVVRPRELLNRIGR